MKRVSVILALAAFSILSSCEKETGNGALLKIFGDAYEDRAHSVAESEGDIIIAGLRTVITRRDGNFIESSERKLGIIRATAGGSRKWEVTPGSASNDIANKVIVLPSGDIMAAGYTTTGSGTSANTDIYIVRTDANGTLLWESVIGGVGNQSAADIAIKPGGGFMIAGVTDAYRAESGSFTENIAGMKDFFLLEISESGDSIASYAFGYGGNDICVAMKRDLGGGYIMYGTTDNSSEPGLEKNNLLLIRLNEDASNRGSAIIGDQADEYAADFEVLPNGYFLAYTLGADNETNQIGIRRMSTNIQAAPVYKKSISVNGLSSKVNAIAAAPGGDWYLGGRAGTPTSSDILILKVDPDGEPIGTPFISGGNGSQEIFDLRLSVTGDLIAVGKTGYENNTMMCLLKLKY
ncbi:MAG: hypothetical protein FJY11_01435 [Bacteroidetes bacterium]|nr:hypothetical protein [Bacteroidota bacterium]